MFGTTPHDYWKAMAEERIHAFEARSSDGPLLKKLRGFFGWEYFHC